MFFSHKRIEDIRRVGMLSQALQSLDGRSYLFRCAHEIGMPKWTDADITAFVALDQRGEVIFCWGRKFFDKLCDDASWSYGVGSAVDRVAFVLAHETFHVVLRHMTRSDGKVSKVWNLAADIVVNYLCLSYGLYPIPGSIVPQSFPEEWGIDPETQTTEDIYEILLNQADVELDFSPVSGHHDAWENLDETSRQILAAKADEALRNAAEKDEEASPEPSNPIGKLGGDGAGGELRALSNAYTEYGIPWDTHLRRYLGSLYQPHVVEQWDRVPPRLASQWGHVLLPRTHRGMKATGIHILTALDASGSMTEEDIERMAAIHRSLPSNYKVSMASFDTQCYPIDSLDNVIGGGGTSLTGKGGVDEYAEQISADCVICLTDGWFNGGTPKLRRPQDWIFVVNGTDAYVPKDSLLITV